MDEQARDVALSLCEGLCDSGWRFQCKEDRVRARKAEWPAQLNAIVDPGTTGDDAVMALEIDLGAMPLRGERFREVFNREREATLRGFGNFWVRQLLDTGAWAPPISGEAFLHGTSGISRMARLVFIDRCPEERGPAVTERFIAESSRYVEAGNGLAGILQRVYQRTVVEAPGPTAELLFFAPRPAPIESIEDVYPWRR